MPKYGWVARPTAISSSVMRRTVWAGTAKPMPTLPPLAVPSALGTVEMAVLTPTTRRSQSTRGPPELPGLMAVSVWMLPASTVMPESPPPAMMSRSRALTMPEVTVPTSPSGAPIAITCCPTRGPASSLSATVGNPDASTLITARSVAASVPTSVDGLVSPLLSRTLTSPPRSADSMT